MVSYLLHTIQQQQSSGDQFFLPGHFPGSRYYPYLRLHRPDDNLFNTVLTLSVLLPLRSALSADQQAQINEMLQLARPHLAPYRLDRGGTQVYQYWRDERGFHFPNGRFLHRYRKFKSPPDIDDTALAYLTYPHSREQAVGLKNYLPQFANGSRKWSPKLPARFNLPKVYSTWMGSGAMPIEFDMVAMSNLLRAFHAYELPLNEYDEATYGYLALMIQTGYYLEQPFYAAPWYPSAMVIHYQLTKLLADTQAPSLLQLRSLLTTQLHTLARKKLSFMEQILWHSSALRLGVAADPVVFSTAWEQSLPEYTYSIGGMLTAMSSKASWRLASHPIFHWQFRCSAFYLALVLENQVLSRGT